jgi:hypothetical protein
LKVASSKEREIPVVVDRDGIIRARFVDADHRSRVEPAQILAALDDLELKRSR